MNQLFTQPQMEMNTSIEFCNHLRFCIIWVLGFVRGCITQGPLAFNAWDIKMSFARVKGSRKKIHMKMLYM